MTDKGMLMKLFLSTTYNETEVALNKSSLILKIVLQNTQTLQLFEINIKQKLFTKVLKMPS
jgi:hypothetical protein